MSTNIVRISDHFNSPQVQLIRDTNRDCNDVEFNQFMHVAASLNLNPLQKQIYAFVFSKDDPAKRKMSIVIAIDGFRAVANRTGDYRPDEKPYRIKINKAKINELTNPLGIEYADCTVWQHKHGEWHPITARAYWDEFAPIVSGGSQEDYSFEKVLDREGNPVLKDNGKQKYRRVLKEGVVAEPRLDPLKDMWRKMARHMIGKCAEAQAIRKGWPEQLSGVYGQEEMDRAHTIDLTATEMAEQAAVENRLAMVKGANAIMFDMGEGLVNLPLGKCGDMIAAHIAKLQPFEVIQWRNLNRVPLQEFWARAKSDALEVKKLLDKAEAKVNAETVEAGNRDLEG